MRFPTGCGTAIVTPFTVDGRVDEPQLRALVDWQIEEGIDFLVPCGSTGEAQTLTVEERQRVVAATVQMAAGRVPVIAGARLTPVREGTLYNITGRVLASATARKWSSSPAWVGLL